MTISAIIDLLESIAPPSLQEDYDNAGLITGNKNWACSGAIVSLDATEEVIQEAIDKKYNLVIAHHPIVFRGLKKINGKNYVERALILAIKNDIAIYAIHTNLDNVINGVNGMIADKLGLIYRSILAPKQNGLQKLTVYVPLSAQEAVQNALFTAGAGHIGQYSECSFLAEGTGTYKAGEGTNPFAGRKGERHHEKEVKIEVVLPSWRSHAIVQAMISAHPYEEVAYDLFNLANYSLQTGSGLMGELPEALDEKILLESIMKIFNVKMLRHTRLLGKPVKKIAVCGGAGSFLTGAAIGAGADLYLTADVKYHEFFDADSRLLLVDIGHYESEQYSIDLLFDILREKFPNFAVLKTGIDTNPVHYL
ncbi:MAG TPA: Nif3-like dinuclear metal center hexameric protein [Ferruginibacter sp.]|nr:Nif3-like dinuclear metal center hexameric protein [Ferruginibacter sp.]